MRVDENRARVTVVVLVVLAAVVAGVDGRRHRGILVGARSEVKDVRTNREIQELGRFSVAEFNFQQRQKQSEEEQRLLMFDEVVEAERQVVSGIKYYLKIQTTHSDSNRVQVYDAVVVVKPWLDHRQLVHFTPSPSYSAN
ncbi:unnamed protein product [Linum tenue]|uniref:Cystatin domain-containing protein n=1 Tax=Linum tenue TaxID=586396 RepID=A0AAV0N431_9ROSI|nr:unnamed protein product [Linum tenue]